MDELGDGGGMPGLFSVFGPRIDTLKVGHRRCRKSAMGKKR
jgi:hypothetical protein